MSITAIILCALVMLMFSTKAFADETEYSEDIVEQIRSFLDDDDWHYDFDEERGIFRFGVNLESKLKNVRYFLPVREDGFTVCAVCPINADKDDPDIIKEMAEFICRANYGLRNGNFELDVRDGEIRYKIHVDCEDLIPSREVVRNSIIIPSAMFDRYAEGILDIMFRNATAADAIEKCE